MSDKWQCAQCRHYPEVGQYQVSLGSTGDIMLAAKCSYFDAEVFGHSERSCFVPRDRKTPPKKPSVTRELKAIDRDLQDLSMSMQQVAEKYGYRSAASLYQLFPGLSRRQIAQAQKLERRTGDK